jgi:hypothetical protein
VTDDLDASVESATEALREHLSQPAEPAGCDDDGVPSPEVADWVLNVYARSVEILTALFMERGWPRQQADVLARTCLARLANAKPPITVELLGD